MRPAYLGIDGGSSSVRLCLVTPTGEVLGRAAAAWSTNLHLYPREEHLPVGRLAAAARALADTHEARVEGICLGTAGIDAPGDPARFTAVYAELARIDPTLPAPRVCSDVDIIGAEGEAEVRVAVIAGTGSNCLGGRYAPGALLPTEVAYVGGLDLPLTDWGSAARIGRMALEHAVRASCGVVPVTALAPALFVRLGLGFPGDWRRLKEVEAGLAKPALGALAREVDAAAKGGDPHARTILRIAGREIAETVIAAARRLGAGPAPEVLCVGGVVCGNRRVRREVERRVRAAYPAANLHDADPARGAARLARG